MKKDQSLKQQDLTQQDLSQRSGDIGYQKGDDDIREVGYDIGSGMLHTSCKPFSILSSKPAASGSPAESSGGDNDYWLLEIKDPKRLDPYTVECEDIIEAFEMTFQEGEAFKAIWRKCGQRMGNGKPGNTALRDAEKAAHFGNRMLAIEKRKL